MPNWICVMVQDGEGCDYTIGCGYRIKTFDAPDLDSAKAKAISAMYMTEYFEGDADPSCYIGGERNLCSWKLYQISDSVDMLALLKEADAIQQTRAKLEQEVKERAELDRLHQKYGV